MEARESGRRVPCPEYATGDEHCRNQRQDQPGSPCEPAEGRPPRGEQHDLTDQEQGDDGGGDTSPADRASTTPRQHPDREDDHRREEPEPDEPGVRREPLGGKQPSGDAEIGNDEIGPPVGRVAQGAVPEDVEPHVRQYQAAVPAAIAGGRLRMGCRASFVRGRRSRRAARTNGGFSPWGPLALRPAMPIGGSSHSSPTRPKDHGRGSSSPKAGFPYPTAGREKRNVTSGRPLLRSESRTAR